MNRLVFALLLIVPVAAFAIDAAAPEEPGIVLPTTLLEVEDLQVEEITAIVPDGEFYLLPEMNIPLPQAEEIFLPEEKFDIPYPDQLEGGQASVVYRPQRRADIFSDGEIAVGSMNHVRGDLNLYRLGPDPRFDLRFYHDKIDGYGLRPAGSGYFHSDDILQGSLSFGSGPIALDANGGITESSDGLQGVGDYEILSYRRVYGSVNGIYPANDKVDLLSTISASYAQQILSSSAPSSVAEIGVDALVGIGLHFTNIDFGAEIDYGFLDSGVSDHRAGFGLTAVYSPVEAFSLGLDAGIVWDRLAVFRYPFSLAVRWDPSDAFGVEIDGGYLVRPVSYGELRDDYQFLEMGDTLRPEYGWFGSFDLQSRLSKNALIYGTSRFEYLDLRYLVSDTANTGTGLFPVAAAGPGSSSLDVSAGIDLEIGARAQFSAGWNGRIIGAHPFYPDHQIESSLSFQGADDTFGGEARATIPLSVPVIMPLLELSGYYRISESVRFSLDVADPLSPLLQAGRQFWGPYEAPGFHFYLSTNISL